MKLSIMVAEGLAERMPDGSYRRVPGWFIAADGHWVRERAEEERSRPLVEWPEFESPEAQ